MDLMKLERMHVTSNTGDTAAKRDNKKTKQPQRI